MPTLGTMAEWSIARACKALKSSVQIRLVPPRISKRFSLESLFCLYMYEPKKNSTEPQSGTRELNIDDYGRIRSKGYIHLSIYHKMRKRQYGNRWMTQFVLLCRDEVKRLEERREMEQSRTSMKSMQNYINQTENNPQHTNSTHGVRL